MFNQKGCIRLFAITLILFAGPVLGQELLPNPGFEGTTVNPVGSCPLSGKSISGNVINGWYDNSCLTTTPPTTLNYAQEGAAGNVHGGTYAQRAQLTTGYMQFRSPDLALTTGKTYGGSIWLRSSGSMSVTVALQNVNSPWTRYGTTTVTVGTNWTQVSFSTTVPTAMTGMLVLDTSSPGTLWMDDASVDDNGDLYVSPSGNSATCTLAAPCSLTQARDRVRTMNGTMTRDINVYLRGGIYDLGSTFALTSQDSGKEPYRIYYKAYANETPVIRGGTQPVVGWHLYNSSKNIYGVSVPGMATTRQLWVNGKRAQRARTPLNPVDRANFYPNAAHTGYTMNDPLVTSMASWRNIQHAEVVQHNLWHHYRCPIESVSGNTIVMAQPCWTLAHGYNPSGQDVYSKYQGGPNLTMGATPWDARPITNPFWIENAYELLDQPGEWYHDRTGAMLYYIPRPGENMSTATVMAPRLETLVSIIGTAAAPVENITFQGITFEYATWLGPNWSGTNTTYGYPAVQGGVMLSDVVIQGHPSLRNTPGNITVEHGRRINFFGNVFQHLGAAAISYGPGSRWSQIDGNRFEDISGGAIFFGDGNYPADDSARTTLNWITNNYIARVGRDYYDAIGINVGLSQDMTIDHNELYDLPYTAISAGSNWWWQEPPWPGRNVISNNRVQNAMQRAHDGGMIYTNGQQGEEGAAGRGSSITGNYLVSQTHLFGGIYLDSNTAWFTVDNNVVSSAPYWLVLQRMGGVSEHHNTWNLNNYRESFTCCSYDTERGGPALGDSVNVISPGAWPAAARAIADNSGLPPAYQNIRNPVVKIEAEGFNNGGSAAGAFSDTSPGNGGGAYRGDLVTYPSTRSDVDIWQCVTCSGDHNVGGTATGEYTSYSVYIDKDGLYDFEFSVASPNAGNSLQLVIDSQPGGQFVAVPKTSDYPNWTNYTIIRLTGIPLTKGPHVLSTVFHINAPYDIAFDYFTYKAQ